MKIAEIARSTYYYWVKQFTRPDKYKEVKEIIKQIFDEHKKEDMGIDASR